MAVENNEPLLSFRHGPTLLAQLYFYAALSIVMFVLDLRFQALDTVRQGLTLITDPFSQLAQVPARLFNEGSSYFTNLEQLKSENQLLKTESLKTAPELTRLPQLEAENTNLRALLRIQEREKVAGQVARILYTSRDPFSRRVYLDKGGQSELEAGQPVIDASGLVGQVTRVFPMSAELTLLTDKSQSVPVQVLRTGLRSFVQGTGMGRVELKYVPANADIESGDMLVTSGLDGLYQPGFPVARVEEVKRESNDAFAKITAIPVAAVENNMQVMILHSRKALPPHPETGGVPAKASAKPPRRRPALAP